MQSSHARQPHTIIQPTTASAGLSNLASSQIAHHFQEVETEKVNATTGFTNEELFETHDDDLDAGALINNEPYNPCEGYSQHQI